MTRRRTSAAEAMLLVCRALTDDALALRRIERSAHDVLPKSALTHASVARACASPASAAPASGVWSPPSMTP